MAYQNKYQEEYENKVKKFLSEQVRKNSVDNLKLKNIVTLALKFTNDIENKDDIAKAFQFLESDFPEFHTLVEDYERQKKQIKQQDFDIFLADLIADISLQDIDEANRLIAFKKENPNITKQQFFSYFPNYLTN